MSADDLTTPVEYRDIPGLFGYQAGDDGSIRVLHNTRRVPCEPRLLKGHVTHKGYRRVMLHSGPNQHVVRFVHDLVLEAFVGPRPDGMECCHWDGDKLNNRLENLRWDTSKANGQDKVRQGLVAPKHGSHNGRATLNEPTVANIKYCIAEGIPDREIMWKFDLTRNVYFKIKHGRTWTHVSG